MAAVLKEGSWRGYCHIGTSAGLLLQKSGFGPQLCGLPLLNFKLLPVGHVGCVQAPAYAAVCEPHCRLIHSALYTLCLAPGASWQSWMSLQDHCTCKSCATHIHLEGRNWCPLVRSLKAL